MFVCLLGIVNTKITINRKSIEVFVFNEFGDQIDEVIWEPFVTVQAFFGGEMLNENY